MIISDNAILFGVGAGTVVAIFSIMSLLARLNGKMDEMISILNQINDKIKDPDDDEIDSL